MSIINKACIKVNMLCVAVHEKKKKNMLVLPVEVVLLENLKMHLKFTIDDNTSLWTGSLFGAWPKACSQAMRTHRAQTEPKTKVQQYIKKN